MDIDNSVLEVLRKVGIEEFTDAQKTTIPAILSGSNVLLITPSGSGKTEAAIVPILHRIFREKPKPISCIYITPLRALNRDMLKRVKFLAGELGLKAAVRHSDTPVSERSRHVTHPPDILITTPETLQILLVAKKMKSHLKNVKWVVVDEVHELADDERGAQLAVGLERLHHLSSDEFQRIGLSATVGSPDEVGHFLVGNGRKVEIINIPVPKEMDIKVVCPEIRDEDKKWAEENSVDPNVAASLRFSIDVIEGHRSSLMFVNTRDNAEFLGSRFHLMDEDFRIGVHHGSLSKEVRIQMEDEFKSQILKALICTSSLELGIDIGSVDLVLQYNSPRQVTRILQRIGRSGHAIKATSRGIIIANEADEISEACAIAERASRRELETVRIRENNLAVLANQLVAMAMGSRMPMKEAFGLVKRSYPFRNLAFKDFQDLVELLRDIKLVKTYDGVLSKAYDSFQYFFGNISMIPDEKSYKVRDLTTRRVIGTLDERFVESFAAEGMSFVMRGLSWQLIEVKDDEVLAEPQKIIGTIPSWVGEEIPVPFEVATLVGSYRRKGQLCESADANCNSVFFKYLADQKKSGNDVPHDRLVTIEDCKTHIIINACFGTRVNETLGQLISSFLSARLGETVRVSTDPYRIILETPRPVGPAKVEEILRGTDPKALPQILHLVAKNSGYFRWQLIRAAKKIGALKKDTEIRTLSISRFIDAYEDTPLAWEAVERTIWEMMDVEKTAGVLSDIQNGDIELKATGPSPIGLAHGEKGGHVMLPRKPDAVTLEAMKKRLENERIVLQCLYCHNKRRHVVKDLPEKIKCQKCGGVLLAAIPVHRLRRKSADDKKSARLYKNANLVMAYGKKAVLALMGRGVGEDIAARILRNLHENESEFLRDLLKAEISYARTRRFWD
jgi:ATP-dependent Lhr-like helicase